MIDDDSSPDRPVQATDPPALSQRTDVGTRRKESLTIAQIEAMDPIEMLEVMRQLEASQIELKLQNKNLRQAYSDLKASRSEYFDLYNFAPVGFFTINKQGLILKANLTAATLLGVAQSALADEPISRFILEQDRDSYRLQCRQLFESREPQVCELQMLKHDGTSFWAHLQSRIQGDAAAECEILCALSDISERKEADELLAREQKLLKTLVNLLPTMVFIKDRDSCFELANNACAHAMGVSSPDELLGKSDADFYPLESAAKFRSDELRVMKGIPLLNSEQRREFPDGTWKILLTSKVPNRDSEGKIVGVVGTSFDITDRVINEKLLAWEKEALVSIVSSDSLSEVLNRLMLGLEEHAPTAIFSVMLLDEEGMHLQCGAAPSLPESYTDALDGIPLGGMMGLHGMAIPESPQALVADIGSDPLWADYRELALEHGLHTCWSTPICCSEGKALGTVAIYYRKPHNPTAPEKELVERAVHMIRLAIERAKASEAVREFRVKLEQRVKQRTAELQTTNKELESFSHSVSHDLRAPLRAINGYAHIVLEEHAGQLDAEGRRMLGVVEDEARRMGRLIDDLLAFSSLGRQPIKSSQIDMGAMVQEVFAELAARHLGRKAQLDLHSLPPANGSAAMIRQVWVNLISNALKFSSKREISKIKIGSQKGDDGTVIYYIKDNGAGFDMAHSKKLFGVFQRLHGQQEFAGTGVGLSLVQRILQRHGGRVWAEAEVDRGATFFFTLTHKKS